jgi:hypothetical protein
MSTISDRGVQVILARTNHQSIQDFLEKHGDVIC